MPNAPVEEKPTGVPDPEFLAHKDLQFDLQNPRFIGKTLKDEFEIIQYLYDTMDVLELVQSILSRAG